MAVSRLLLLLSPMSQPLPHAACEGKEGKIFHYFSLGQKNAFSLLVPRVVEFCQLSCVFNILISSLEKAGKYRHLFFCLEPLPRRLILRYSKQVFVSTPRTEQCNSEACKQIQGGVNVVLFSPVKTWISNELQSSVRAGSHISFSPCSTAEI